MTKSLACADSDRPGFIVFARYYDRRVEPDVIGEFKIKSGADYMRCMSCRGTGRAVGEEARKQEG